MLFHILDVGMASNEKELQRELGQGQLKRLLVPGRAKPRLVLGLQQLR
jgi:hypothetical protein